MEAASAPVPIPAPAPPAAAGPAGPSCWPPRGRGARADVHRGGVGAGAAVPPDGAARRAGRGRPGDHRRGTGHDRGRAGLAGGGDGPAGPAAHPGGPAPGRGPGQHRGGPGAARGVQQPVHVRCRADGRAPAVHRPLGQHQGAARLLLRDLRRRRRPDRQRPAHPGAPGLNGGVDQDGDQPEQGPHEAGRRLRPQRPLPRRHAPSRRHRGHPRFRPALLTLLPRGATAARDLVLRRLAGASRGDRRGLARLDAGEQRADRGRGRADRQLAAGRGRRVPRGADAGLADRRGIPVARPGDQPRRPARPDRGEREGRRGTAPDGRPVRPRRRPRLHDARAGERRGSRQGGDHRAARRRVQLRDGQRRADPGAGDRRPREPHGHDRLHRHVGAAGGQLQRPVERGHGGRALRVPDPGRQGDPAERRLPAAAERDHPAGHDAVARVPGRGRGRQRGDQPGGHRCPVRRPREHGRGIGDDEQRDVRQRAVPVLRDGRERLRGGRGLRRHRRGADEDDELPADRPRGARVAVPGPARVLRDPPRQRRTRPLARRRRRHPPDQVPRADDRHHAQRPPPGARVRPGRRRPRRARPPLGGTRGRFGHRNARLRQR